jgi:NYN domain
MPNVYFFFDGSSLISQIRQLQAVDSRFSGHKLKPLNLAAYCDRLDVINDGLGTRYKRVVFYFADGDPHVEKFLELPDFGTPGLINDVEFKYCGRKLARSASYDTFLQTVPAEFLDKCQKSEKGVHIEICCDALHLAASGRLDRLILSTNDSDFVPLCRKLKVLGANVSLLRLSEARSVNRELVEACDTYDVIEEPHLLACFGVSAALRR